MPAEHFENTSKYTDVLMFGEPIKEKGNILTESYSVLSSFRKGAKESPDPQSANNAHDTIQKLLATTSTIITENELKDKFKDHVDNHDDIEQTFKEISNKKLIRYHDQFYVLSYTDDGDIESGLSGSEIVSSNKALLNADGTKASLELAKIGAESIQAYKSEAEIKQDTTLDQNAQESAQNIISNFKSFEFLEIFVRGPENQLTKEVYRVTPLEGGKIKFTNIKDTKELVCGSKTWQKELQVQKPDVALLRSYYSDLFTEPNAQKFTMTAEYFPTRSELMQVLEKAFANRDVDLLQMLARTNKLSEGILNEHPEIFHLVSQPGMEDLKDIVLSNSLFTSYTDQRPNMGSISTEASAASIRQEEGTISINEVTSNPNDYQGALLDACLAKDINKVNVLLACGVKANFSIKGKSPLMEALKYTPGEVQAILGENDEGYKDLLKKRREIQKQLRENYNREGIEKTQQAIEQQIKNSDNLTQTQLDALNAKILIMQQKLAKCTELEGELDEVKANIEKTETQILKSMPAENSRLEIVKALIQAGATKETINEAFQGFTKQWLKKSDGIWEFRGPSVIASILIEAGADPIFGKYRMPLTQRLALVGGMSGALKTLVFSTTDLLEQKVGKTVASPLVWLSNKLISGATGIAAGAAVRDIAYFQSRRLLDPNYAKSTMLNLKDAPLIGAYHITGFGRVISGERLKSYMDTHVAYDNVRKGLFSINDIKSELPYQQRIQLCDSMLANYCRIEERLSKFMMPWTRRGLKKAQAEILEAYKNTRVQTGSKLMDFLKPISEGRSFNCDRTIAETFTKANYNSLLVEITSSSSPESRKDFEQLNGLVQSGALMAGVETRYVLQMLSKHLDDDNSIEAARSKMNRQPTPTSTFKNYQKDMADLESEILKQHAVSLLKDSGCDLDKLTPLELDTVAKTYGINFKQDEKNDQKRDMIINAAATTLQQDLKMRQHINRTLIERHNAQLNPVVTKKSRSLADMCWSIAQGALGIVPAAYAKMSGVTHAEASHTISTLLGNMSALALGTTAGALSERIDIPTLRQTTQRTVAPVAAVAVPVASASLPWLSSYGPIGVLLGGVIGAKYSTNSAEGAVKGAAVGGVGATVVSVGAGVCGSIWNLGSQAFNVASQVGGTIGPTFTAIGTTAATYPLAAAGVTIGALGAAAYCLHNRSTTNIQAGVDVGSKKPIYVFSEHILKQTQELYQFEPHIHRNDKSSGRTTGKARQRGRTNSGRAATPTTDQHHPGQSK
ncbi:hypothetical protein EDM53_00605 [Rickettsiales endosymbiont of Peranema trichophorum]|uniref:hypothetical protein n=1 Tax=Rickettsiales endosymbiont of Peranema trichophorum TaxID=2486577 RepID=UPI0010F02018|nr:hypothetical protein [Rickettsiales endosymbiont of Peranema trichophorum]RZI47656.1 hypothetical protein EDM53_00605 [Rickettsiales endosymbiont of Peranema trichophorum]